MELVVIAAIGALLWLILSGTYKTRLQNPLTLAPSDLEESIIELKKKILVTCAYKAEAEYSRLYRRLTVLTGQVLERHEHFVLDVEAKKAVPVGFFSSGNHRDSNGMNYSTQYIPSDLNPSNYASDLLIYASFFLWHGGEAKTYGSIDANPKLMMEILDFLIEDRSYGPAIFMKGLVRKYGLNVQSQCFPTEATQLLMRAQEAGIGSAAIELQYISKYAELEGIASVQLGE
jgi:hypothetical protein